MKVIDNRTEAASIDFIDVKYGIPFEFEKNLFIKTNNCLVTNDDFTNAVDLKSGILCKFGDMEQVRLVNASIVINNFEEE